MSANNAHSVAILNEDVTQLSLHVLAVLREATSPDYNRMRQAEEMLKQWENEPSFFATLQVSFLISTRLIQTLNMSLRTYFTIAQLSMTFVS